ncbi:HET domain-containing protein [Fusarium sp. LHS14.1]|nr:HET domain-containing protein [Fusarium sp. LHS14.1]
MSSKALCQWCAQIPFHNLPCDAENPTWFYLGTGSRVKNSSCPLCQLVVEAHYEKDADLLGDNPIYLKWREGPECGFAFELESAGRDVWISFGLLESTNDAACVMRTAHPRTCLLRPTTSLIDTSRVLGWIRSCEQEHGDHCQLPTQVPFAEAFRGLPFIRLIDVQAACLVEIQRFVKYTALSYVWGAVTHFRLTKANRPVLLMSGSLKKVSDRIPATIRDAIAVVKRLGCRYLWVDALCLIQNDADDLSQGVDAMDLIYERAWLTIVAACGHDANARLPGAQDATRKPSINARHVVPGIAMGVMVGLDDRLGRSMYDTRGWTFQERLLSRRAIYFVDDHLFYRCRRTAQAEHLMDLPSPAGEPMFTMQQLPSDVILMRHPVLDFSWILEFYTKRILTNQSDAPRAMAGIIQRFSVAMGCQFLEGLPTATFDIFILLRPLGGGLRRRPAFPSYSWTGWSGSFKTCLRSIRLSYNDMLRDKTWIIWYKRSTSGIVSLVWDPSCEPFFPLDDLTFVGYRERRPFGDGRHTPAGLDTSRTSPSATIEFSRGIPSCHILQFWTISTFYTISNLDVFDAIGDLVDSNGDKCGFVSLDGFEETTYFESQTHFELILLSEAQFVSDQHLRSCSTSSYPTADGSWNLFNVLLLEWQGGLAERRGVGCLIQEAVDNSLAPGPVWKEILLA